MIEKMKVGFFQREGETDSGYLDLVDRDNRGYVMIMEFVDGKMVISKYNLISPKFDLGDKQPIIDWILSQNPEANSPENVENATKFVIDSLLDINQRVLEMIEEGEGYDI